MTGAAARFAPSRRPDAWDGVHRARYHFARPYAAQSRRVLDVACGSGYGLSILENGGGTVVGVDLDSAALHDACKSIPHPLVAADGSRLPFADGTFELVTSFETLEHLERRGTFLREIRRVLASDGLLILSTPNANVTEPIDGKPRNPHHVHEYRPQELRAELLRVFARVEMLGQTLHPRFKLSPFREDQAKLPKTLSVQAQLFAWKILYHLPAAPRDAASRLLWGHPLIAGAADYRFLPDGVDRAPVLVAVCGS